MGEPILRPSRPGDRPELKALWAAVFGDTEDYIDTFFQFYGQSGTAMVMELDGHIVSGIYLVPMGGICFPDGTLLPAGITYALATYPEYRSRGFGAAVMRAAIQLDFDRGSQCSSLCPAEDSLFPYYTRRIGYRDCFYLREAELSPERLPRTGGTVRPAAPEEYNAFRNRFLRGRLFMMFDDTGIRYQARLCADTGGGLYRMEGPGFDACACCEYGEDGALLVKELLCPEEHCLQAAGLLSRATDARRWRVRTPSDLGRALGGQVRRYGQMMRSDGKLDFLGQTTGYYGFGFD